MPEVSVIMPVYNCERFLGEAIESVLAQTYEDWELIIVDDGSTDRSSDIIRTFSDDRIYYIERSSNSGSPSLPRNIGISRSSGKYIAFIDQDDIYLPTSLYKRLSFFSNHPDESFVYSNCAILYEANDRKIDAHSDILSLLNKQPIEGRCFRQLFLFGCCIPIQTAMMKRDVFLKVGLFNENLIGTDDYNMWLHMSYFFNINYIDECLSKWRVHKESLSNRTLLMEKNTALSIEHAVYELPDVEKLVGKMAMRRRMHQVCFDVAYGYIKDGNLKAARYWMKKAWFWGRKPKTFLRLIGLWCRPRAHFLTNPKVTRVVEEQKKPIKVLFTSSTSFIAGAQTNLLSLLSTLNKNKFLPYLLYNPRSQMEKFCKLEKITFIPLELPHYCKKNIFLVLKILVKLFLLLYLHRIDLVYINTNRELKFFVPVCNFLQIPIIFHLHFKEDDSSLRWLKVGSVARILFPSRWTMESVLEQSPWIDKKKCICVYNAVDVSKFHKKETDSLRRSLSLRDHKPIIGIVGRLREDKGQNLFLEMAKILIQKGIETHFIIVGEDKAHSGKYEAFLRQRVQSLGIKDYINFLGFRKDIVEIMSLFDLLVVPSLVEPFGRVVIEAMACGTPVVASAVGGIVEIFKDGEGGLFVRPNDVNDLTRKVLYFFEHPAWWQKQKNTAVRVVKQKFRQETHTAKVEAIMERVYLNRKNK